MEKVYRIEPSTLKDVKNVLEAEDMIGEDTDINQWKRQGYNLRDANSLGMDKEGTYLHVEGNKEFFEENEEEINLEGVKEIKGEEKEKVINKIKKEQQKAAEGMGTIFG